MAYTGKHANKQVMVEVEPPKTIGKHGIRKDSKRFHNTSKNGMEKTAVVSSNGIMNPTANNGNSAEKHVSTMTNGTRPRSRHAKTKEPNPFTRPRTMMTTVTAVAVLSAVCVPVTSAMADTIANNANIPVANAQSATSTDADSNSDDGDTETGDTSSSKESPTGGTVSITTGYDEEWGLPDDDIAKGIIENNRKQDEAIAAKKKAEEEKKKKEAEAKAAKEKAEAEKEAKEQQSASTGYNGTSSSWTQYNLPNVPSSKLGRKITDAAAALVGQNMDCTMLATRALYAATGIWYHGWPEAYMNFPGAVEVNWKDAQPGDILVYPDGSSYDMNGPGHSDHVAIYAGDGMAVHGGWNGYTVAIAPADVSYQPPRVFRVMG